MDNVNLSRQSTQACRGIERTMVKYRRNKLDSPDAIYFITMVTHNRIPIFTNDRGYKLVLNTMSVMEKRFDLHFPAYVILPNHIHWLISPNNADYSNVVFSFKRRISGRISNIAPVSKGAKIWLNRFWERTVRNEDEWAKFVEYIHFNPVKHGFAQEPSEWRFSSFNDYVARGIYGVDWDGGDGVDVAGAEYDV